MNNDINSYEHSQNSLNRTDKMPAQTKRVVIILASIATLLIIAAILVAIVALKQSKEEIIVAEGTEDKTTEEITEKEREIETEESITEKTTEETKEEKAGIATEEVDEEKNGSLSVSLEIEGVSDIENINEIEINIHDNYYDFDKIYPYTLGEFFDSEGRMFLSDLPVGEYNVSVVANGENDTYLCDGITINGEASSSAAFSIEKGEETAVNILISYSELSIGTRFDMVRGGYYYTPDGFENITKETYALRYVQEWKNYDLDMYIMVTDAMQIDIPITVDEEYEQTISNSGDPSALSLNKKEENGYIISGTTGDGLITYHKVKAFDDRYVSIYITYPSANSETCNQIVEDFVFNFVYE